VVLLERSDSIRHQRRVSRAETCCAVVDGYLTLSGKHGSLVLHPLWVRERSAEPGSVDPSNRQRLLEPLDVPADLTVCHAAVAHGGGVEVHFSDGHRMHLSAEHVDTAFGCSEVDALPCAVPWTIDDAGGALAVFDYATLGRRGAAADTMMLAILDQYFRHGWFMLRNTPAIAGALHEITAHFGRISATNFGTLFDVRTEQVPSDLAYTPVALSAHTDQPYRRPTPGLQFLHTIVNDAPGGASTVVDGMAAVEALAVADPEAYVVLSTLSIEFRYDVGADVKVVRAPLIELHQDGSFRQLRYSPRLDFAPAADRELLDIYYRGRRWLAAELNSAHRQVEVRMEAGDVMVVDNHRVLHGRTSFDPTRGRRHLQGCYIDHDGPETAWRLAARRAVAREATQP